MWGKKPRRKVTWEDRKPGVVQKGNRKPKDDEPDVEAIPDPKSSVDASSTQEPQSRFPTTEVPSEYTDDDSPSSISVAAYMAIGEDVDPLVEAPWDSNVA